MILTNVDVTLSNVPEFIPATQSPTDIQAAAAEAYAHIRSVGGVLHTLNTGEESTFLMRGDGPYIYTVSFMVFPEGFYLPQVTVLTVTPVG